MQLLLLIGMHQAEHGYLSHLTFMHHQGVSKIKLFEVEPYCVEEDSVEIQDAPGCSVEMEFILIKGTKAAFQVCYFASNPILIFCLISNEIEMIASWGTLNASQRLDSAYFNHSHLILCQELDCQAVSVHLSMQLVYHHNGFEKHGRDDFLPFVGPVRCCERTLLLLPKFLPQKMQTGLRM